MRASTSSQRSAVTRARTASTVAAGLWDGAADCGAAAASKVRRIEKIITGLDLGRVHAVGTLLVYYRRPELITSGRRPAAFLEVCMKCVWIASTVLLLSTGL